MYRRLRDGNPVVFASEFADLLCNYAVHLQDGDQWVDSLSLIKESVDIYQDLVQEYPLRYDEALRFALRVLGVCSEAAGNSSEAQKARDEANLIKAGS